MCTSVTGQRFDRRLAIPLLEQAAKIADEVPAKHALSREYLFMAGDVRPHPALVARYALAEALETDGQEGESLATYQEFVRLCPKYHTWKECIKHRRDLHTTLAGGKRTLGAHLTELDVLDFDFERWIAGGPFVRGQIAGPLAYSDSLIGLTQAEVLDRLGPADESFETGLEYWLFGSSGPVKPANQATPSSIGRLSTGSSSCGES